ncbi:hypothetical protein [Photobacterium halotolerans]|uniref:DUF3899 domain-containing protein n=1 Tax=Photobacterium halotolerans TaxID=265726 RepID=A0A0F5VB68_9GAMM|nr:hypothetical protein [Photobacterium halotolerans]KKC99415.1 hypothetical protein KY46_13715 [Photobacterium halotolerans]
MLNFLKYVLLSNLLAAGAVWVGHKYVEQPFSISGDVLFYMFALQWLLAGMVWNGGKESQSFDDDRPEIKAVSMLSDHEIEADRQNEMKANYRFGFIFFLSGLFPLFACVLLSVFHDLS